MGILSESGSPLWSTNCRYKVVEAIGAFPITNSNPDSPYSLFTPLTVGWSMSLPSSVPRKTITCPKMGLLFAFTTVPPMPAQLQAKSGWMTVLSTCEVDALKGAFGVLVGFGVRVGGKSETGVALENGVNVGRGVLLGVNSSVGLAVQVGASWIGVFVAVGGWGRKMDLPGGSTFKLDPGLRKINPK